MRATKKTALAVLCFCVSIASACATTEGTGTAAPASQSAGQVAPAATTTTVADADEVKCRNYDVTGSRVAKQRVCKTRREWDEDSRRAKEMMDNIDRRNSTQPGGESLKTGG